MTNPPPSTPPEPSGNFFSRLRRFVRRPSAIAIGFSSLALVVIGYTGVRIVVYQVIPAIAEKQLSEILNRPVQIGEVEGFSLNHIRFGPSAIPPTSTDPDRATVRLIEVGFDLLPVLLRRNITFSLTLVEPYLYAEQDKTGALINIELDLEEEIQEKALDIYSDIHAEGGKIEVIPYGKRTPVTLLFDGKGKYNQIQNVQNVQYDVDAKLSGAHIQILGETQVETGRTEAEVVIKDLNLPEIFPIIAVNSPVTLKKGELNTTKLNADIPAFKKLEGSQGRGTLNFSNLEATAKPLKEPIKANFRFNFQGSQLRVEQGKVSLGKIVAQIGGKVDWQKGIDLDINVQPFSLPTLLKTVSVKSPVDVIGQMQVKLQLNGTISNPFLLGSIQNTKPVRVDKIDFNQVNTQFSADLQKFVLKSLQIKPAAGGQVIARGTIQTKLKQSLEQNKKIDFGKMPLAFTFQAALPTEELLAPYYRLPSQVQVGTITAQGQVRGTANNPLASLKWNAPAASTTYVEAISGTGEALLIGNIFILRNTELRTDQGVINVSGNGNFKTKRWQASLIANSFPLDPFVDQLCNTINSSCASLRSGGGISLTNANVRVAGRLDTFDPANIEGVANLLLRVNEGTASVRSRLSRGILAASINAAQIPLEPFIPNVSTPVSLVGARVNLLSNLNQLFRNSTLNLNYLNATADAQLAVARGSVNATARLRNGSIAALVNASGIPLEQFIPNVSTPVRLIDSQVRLSGTVGQLYQDSRLNLNNLTGIANARLAVARGRVNASGELRNGEIVALANASGIPLEQFIPNWSAPVSLVDSQVRVAGNLEQLFRNSRLNLNSLTGTADARLAVAQGRVNATGQLNNNQWRTNIAARGLELAILSRQLPIPSQQRQAIAQLDELNAQLNLSGNLNSLLQDNPFLSIQANSISVQADDQSLSAKGNILLTDLATTPDIARLALDVRVSSNLDALPINQLISSTAKGQQFRPQSVDVTGQAYFNGRLTGRNLLSAPSAPGNIALTGNLRLVDFTLNDREFEPLLAGSLTASPGQTIALNLRGRSDVIAASLEPCTSNRCRFPYLPTSFEIRQGVGTENPIIAEGRRIGDRLIADVRNFPLEVLNIVPAVNYGFPGPLAGQLTASLDVNLFTFATSGQVNIDRPGIGSLQAEAIAANFSYANNQAQLISGTLRIGQSEYVARGSLNLQTQAIQGNLTIDQGRIEDVITALGIYDLNSFVSFFQFKRPDYATAAAARANPVGAPNAPIAEQVNLLWAIEQRIRALAAQKEAGGVPTELDIRGQYTAEVSVAGTLSNPQADFQFQGNRWTWRPQQAYPAIAEPVGLVRKEPSIIPIDKVLLQGNFARGVVQLQPALLQIGDAVVSLEGKLSPQNSSATFSVNNLSLDTVGYFIALPVDVAGRFDATGNITGNLTNPNVIGQVAFINGALNGRSLEQDVTGNFNYTDARLQFQTTAPASLQVYASIPNPLQNTKSDRVELNVKIGTESLELIDVFTQGQVDWLEGDGEVNLQASGRLAADEQITLSNLAVNGGVILQDATLKSAAFAYPLKVNGQIDFDQTRLRSQLTGEFAQTQILVTGVLPLFVPLSSSDPDTATPLTVAIEQGQLQLEELYQGQIDAQIVVNGSVLRPIIGGGVRLANGEIFVPEGGEQSQQASPVANRLLGRRRETPSVIVPRLDDFRVVLENLEVSDSLYEFDFGGDITLNGTLDTFNLNQVRPQGTIKLTRGRISFIETPFVLNRRRENVIVFAPNQGLLNPELDIQFRTSVTEISAAARQRLSQDNEIPEDIFGLGVADRIDITLAVDGRLSQLLPTLGKDTAEVCRIRPENTLSIPQNTTLSAQQLKQLATCVETLALTRDEDSPLINPSGITLTSSPPRSQGEIVSLLGNKVLALVEAVEGKNEEELLQYGLLQLAVPLILQDVVYDVESSIGDTLGVADFRLFPLVETVYRVGDTSFVSVSYDYTFNVVKVEYETRF